MSLAFVFSFLVAASSPEPPWGPLYQRSHAAISDNRLSYTGTPVTPLAPGTLRAQLGLSVANVWAQMPSYFYDGEWDRLQARVSYGLIPRLEVWAELAVVYRSGGFLDGFIEGFHRTFHVTQARRDQYPRNQLRVATIADGVQTDRLADGSRGAGLANPVAGAKWLLWGQGDGEGNANAPHLSAQVALQLPWGSTATQFATGVVAGLAALALQQPLGGKVHLDAAFGVIVAPGAHTVYGVTLSEVQKFLLVTLQVRLWAQGVLAIAYLNQDGIADKATYYPLSATAHEFQVGVRGALMGTVWEAGVIENTIHDANTPDFGLFCGLTRSFE